MQYIFLTLTRKVKLNRFSKNYRLMKLPVASFWYTFAVQPSLLKPVDKVRFVGNN